jgi:hypothetical protein
MTCSFCRSPSVCALRQAASRLASPACPPMQLVQCWQQHRPFPRLWRCQGSPSASPSPLAVSLRAACFSPAHRPQSRSSPGWGRTAGPAGLAPRMAPAPQTRVCCRLQRGHAPNGRCSPGGCERIWRGTGKQASLRPCVLLAYLEHRSHPLPTETQWPPHCDEATIPSQTLLQARCSLHPASRHKPLHNTSGLLQKRTVRVQNERPARHWRLHHILAVEASWQPVPHRQLQVADAFRGGLSQPRRLHSHHCGGCGSPALQCGDGRLPRRPTVTPRKITCACSCACTLTCTESPTNLECARLAGGSGCQSGPQQSLATQCIALPGSACSHDVLRTS